MNSRGAEVLNDLLEVARDGERFYRDAAGHVDNPELRGTFRQMSEVRRRLMDELAEHIRERGAEPSPHGTLAGETQKLYADALAALRGEREDVYLRRLEAAEDRLLERYEQALADTGSDTEALRTLLRRQLLTVRAAHQRMRALRDQGVSH